jgi:Integrase core domain
VTQDLAYSPLGQAEGFADLSQGEPLIKVEGREELLALLELIYGVNELKAQLPAIRLGLGSSAEESSIRALYSMLTLPLVPNLASSEATCTREYRSRKLRYSATTSSPTAECTVHLTVFFGKRLVDEGLLPSKGRVGSAYDNNALAESFVATLKTELLYRAAWPTRQAARTTIFEYIEGFYNTRRRHSSLDHHLRAYANRRVAYVSSNSWEAVRSL